MRMTTTTYALFKFNSLLTEMITPQTYKYNIIYIYTYKTASCPSCIQGSLRLAPNNISITFFVVAKITE